MLSTKTILVTLFFVCLIGTLIFLFIKYNKDNKDNQPNYNWTDVQKSDLDKIIYDPKISLPLSVKKCIRNAIISNMSYDDFKSKNLDKEVIPFILNKVHCLGTIGNWDSDYKEYIITMIKSNKISDLCANCIVNALETQFDPFDALVKIKTDEKFINDIIRQKCSNECLQH
jgi:hypothetical protein